MNESSTSTSSLAIDHCHDKENRTLTSHKLGKKSTNEEKKQESNKSFQINSTLKPGTESRSSRVVAKRKNHNDVEALGGVLATLTLQQPTTKITTPVVAAAAATSSVNENENENENECTDYDSEMTESIQSSYYKSSSMASSMISLVSPASSASSSSSSYIISTSHGKENEEPLHSTSTKLFPIIDNDNGVNSDGNSDSDNDNDDNNANAHVNTDSIISANTANKIDFTSPKPTVKTIKPPTSQITYRPISNHHQLTSPLEFGQSPFHPIIQHKIKLRQKNTNKYKIKNSCTIESDEDEQDEIDDDEVKEVEEVEVDVEESSIEISIYKSKKNKEEYEDEESFQYVNYDTHNDDGNGQTDEYDDDDDGVDDGSFFIQEPYIPYGRRLSQLDSAGKKFVKNECLYSDEDDDDDEETISEEEYGDSEDDDGNEDDEICTEYENEIHSESAEALQSDTETEDDESRTSDEDEDDEVEEVVAKVISKKGKKCYSHQVSNVTSSTITASIGLSQTLSSQSSSPTKEHRNYVDVVLLDEDLSVDEIDDSDGHDKTEMDAEIQLVSTKNEKNITLISRRCSELEEDEDSYSSDSDHILPEKHHSYSTDKNSMHTLSRQTSNKSKRSGKNVGKVKRGKWSLGSRIGEGSFGIVYVGMNNITGNLMAVKSLRIPMSSSSELMEDLQREIDLMRSFEHRNIVRYIGAEMDSDKQILYIFQEWVTGGSITSLLDKFGSFPVAVIRSYLHQILCGLEYLHSNRILHRDIKGGNVLVNDEGVVKLADFGASKKVHVTNNGTVVDIEDMMEQMTMRGTPYFMAPEVFEATYGPKADVWAAGCVAHQMFTGQPPWKGMGLKSPTSLFMHLKKSSGPPPLIRNDKHDINNTITASTANSTLQQVLSQSFERDVARRPTVQMLLQNKFFVENDLNESILDDDSAVETSSMNVMATFNMVPSTLSPISPQKLADMMKIGKDNLGRDNIIENVDDQDWPLWAKETEKEKISKNPFTSK